MQSYTTLILFAFYNKIFISRFCCKIDEDYQKNEHFCLHTTADSDDIYADIWKTEFTISKPTFFSI